jgi:hypothetical protein
MSMLLQNAESVLLSSYPQAHAYGLDFPAGSMAFTLRAESSPSLQLLAPLPTTLVNVRVQVAGIRLFKPPRLSTRFFFVLRILEVANFEA